MTRTRTTRRPQAASATGRASTTRNGHPSGDRSSAAASVARELTERERRFVAAYMGPAAGNAAEAARLAGYARASAKVTGTRLLARPHVRAAIEAQRAQDEAAGTATRQDRQRFWTATMLDPNVSMRDRLKASELLARSEGDFIERRETDMRVQAPVKVVHVFVDSPEQLQSADVQTARPLPRQPSR